MKMESQNIYIKNIPRVSLRIALKQKQQKQTNKQTVGSLLISLKSFLSISNVQF